MSDHELWERRLSQLRARGAPPPLRSRVLGAVERELASSADRRALRWAALLAAASVLLGIAMNAWVIHNNQTRMARLCGPRSMSAELVDVVEMVEEVAGPEAGQWAHTRLAQALRSQVWAPQDLLKIQQNAIQQIAIDWELTRKDGKDESSGTMEATPEAGGDRSGGVGRRLFDGLRDPGLVGIGAA